MKKADFIAKFGTAAVPKVDFVVLHCCADAVYQVLAGRFWGGDVSKVNNGQVFADTYGMEDADMIPFTVAVEGRLNANLAAQGRGPVVLGTGPGQTVPASANVGQYIGATYYQAMGQNP